MALAVYIWLFNVVLVVNALLGFYDSYFWKVLLWMFVFKVGAETLFLLPIMRFFRRSALVWLAVPLSLMHIFYLVYIGIIGNSKKYMWKGRLVR
ncbi:MAG: hypothetical protein EOP46_20890 [Sphingobacteriaceae bacterium]|nr:MAG: hypothetical protein EOP46_20890 [Sphingobacteriaceae bacterium]